MNLIEIIRVIRNPNIIDTIDEKRLSEEMVEFAIQSGYLFNSDAISRLIKFRVYCDNYKDNVDLLKYKVNEAKELDSLRSLFEFCNYNKNKFFEIIINDDELIEMMINKYVFAIIGQDNLVELVKQKPQFLDEIIKKNLQPSNKFMRYVISVKKFNEIQQLVTTDKYEEYIASCFRKNEIKIDKVPSEFLKSTSIMKAILAKNTHLFDNYIVIMSLKEIISKMNDEKKIEYLKEINYPFDAKHVMESLPVIIECIKNDCTAHPHTRHLYSKEEYLKIFNETNEYLKPEMILDNLFLIENPYFVKSLIMQGVEIDINQLLDTRYYEEMYLELKAEAIKNNMYIPRPPKYDDVIQFEGNIIFVEADKLENVIKGIQYIKEHGIEQDLTVMLRQGKYDEFLITDNYAFFKELQKYNINIDFTYNSGENVYHLDKVLKDEELLQSIVADIKSKNFSPLEELIAVYDIVKVFKPYKDLETNEYGDTTKSRSLYEYLNNNYMVCAGYADFFTNLCKRLGIRCADIGLMIIDNDANKMYGHARNYVDIVDTKYGIDGLYVVDSTWENNGKARVSNYEEIKSTYKQFLLTTDEGRKRPNKDREISINPNDDLEGYDIWMTSKNIEELQNYFKGASSFRIDKTRRFIEGVMPEIYEQIKDNKLEDEESCRILLDYLKRKVNRPYNEEKLLEAVLNVKKKVYENMTETEVNDMRLGYLLTQPFSKINKNKWDTPEVRAKYKDFLSRRFKKKDDGAR